MIASDRKKAFDGIRVLFGGSLNQAQVDFFESFFKEWDRRGLTDLRWAAYMLATVQHETASTMLPIEEYGKGKTRPYGKPDPITGQTYFGRGYVQLTWKQNYANASGYVGEDLVRHPEKAMEPSVAMKILFDGMISGWFTGKALRHYLTGNVTDWFNARRIINGLDKAQKIALKAEKYYNILKGSA